MDKRGLYGKFIIEKANGESIHPDARYMVMNYAQDPHARIAVAVYADSVEAENPTLAAELRAALAEPHTAHSHEVRE